MIKFENTYTARPKVPDYIGAGKSIQSLFKNQLVSANDDIQNQDGIYYASFGSYKLRSAFQPIYAVVPNALTLYAYEALVRPEAAGRNVSPAELFDPNSGHNLAELDRLCRSVHIRNYQLVSNENATLFVNVNPSHFIDEESVDAEFEYLLSDLRSQGIPAANLVCEIIEAEAANNAIITRMCRAIRELGAKIAVDDYGSDHSEWHRFELVQPDILKPDGPVFRNLCKTPAAIPALEKLTNSLHEIGCILLVEGVETRNQFDIAIEAGISLIQGYFLAKPAQTSRQFPRIPTAPFLPGQNKLSNSQAFHPTISFQELNGLTQ